MLYALINTKIKNTITAINSIVLSSVKVYRINPIHIHSIITNTVIIIMLIIVPIVCLIVFIFMCLRCCVSCYVLYV